MGLNYNEQESGGINKETDVTDDQESKEFFTDTNITDADTDDDMGLNDYAILKQNNVITGNQYDTSALTSITGGNQDDPANLTSTTVDSYKSSNVTPDKGHRKNLVESSPSIKYPIH